MKGAALELFSETIMDHRPTVDKVRRDPSHAINSLIKIFIFNKGQLFFECLGIGLFVDTSATSEIDSGDNCARLLVTNLLGRAKIEVLNECCFFSPSPQMQKSVSKQENRITLLIATGGAHQVDH